MDWSVILAGIGGGASFGVAIKAVPAVILALTERMRVISERRLVDEETAASSWKALYEEAKQQLDWERANARLERVRYEQDMKQMRDEHAGEVTALREEIKALRAI